MMTSVDGLYGGLSQLAETLKVERIGPMHQAGSDSLLTMQTYFALVKRFWPSNYDENRFKGELFGLGANHTRQRAKQYLQASTMSVSSASVAPLSSYSSSSSVSSTSYYSRPSYSQGYNSGQSYSYDDQYHDNY